MWAFGYEPHEAEQVWSKVTTLTELVYYHPILKCKISNNRPKIPFDTDILLCHTPPKYHLDERSDRRSVGCPALRERLWRVRPRLHICGHIHESRGVEIVKWDLTQSNIKYKEEPTIVWEDPGVNNKKFSIVNLTKKNGMDLKNDGSIGDRWQVPEDEVEDGGSASGQVRRRFIFSAEEAFKPPELPARAKTPKKAKPRVEEGVARLVTSLAAIPTPSLPPATIGQGGMPPSGRCDIEALSGRMGRRETCVVNAAIVGNSFSNKATGKKFNKPIVVDIDLPVWRDNG